jgi:hypothetical protein
MVWMQAQPVTDQNRVPRVPDQDAHTGDRARIRAHSA